MVTGNITWQWYGWVGRYLNDRRQAKNAEIIGGSGKRVGSD